MDADQALRRMRHLEAEARRLREALEEARLRAEWAEAQRDHARALCTWEYYGRGFSEPRIDPAYDDGWTYREREVGDRWPC